MEKLLNEKWIDDSYKEDAAFLNDPSQLSPTALGKAGLSIQAYTLVEYEGKVSMRIFLVGKGVFYEVGPGNGYDYAAIYTDAADQIIIPQYGLDGIEKVFVKRHPSSRDFSKHPVIENLRWIILNVQAGADFMDSVDFHEGGIMVSMYPREALKILAPTVRSGCILLEGVIQDNEKSLITDYDFGKVFVWESR